MTLYETLALRVCEAIFKDSIYKKRFSLGHCQTFVELTPFELGEVFHGTYGACFMSKVQMYIKKFSKLDNVSVHLNRIDFLKKGITVKYTVNFVSGAVS